jgi:hypothetical protein
LFWFLLLAPDWREVYLFGCADQESDHKQRMEDKGPYRQAIARTADWGREAYAALHACARNKWPFEAV